MPASAQSASRLNCAAESGINNRSDEGPARSGYLARIDRPARGPSSYTNLTWKRITPRCRRYGERPMGWRLKVRRLSPDWPVNPRISASGWQVTPANTGVPAATGRRGSISQPQPEILLPGWRSDAKNAPLLCCGDFRAGTLVSRTRHTSLRAALEALRGSLPEHVIAHLITMAQVNRDNRYDRMTDAFQQLVGRAPISAAEFARRHAGTFSPQAECRAGLLNDVVNKRTPA